MLRILFGVLTTLLLNKCSNKNTISQFDLDVLAQVGNKIITKQDFIRRAEYTIRPDYCRQSNYIHKKIILNSLIAEKLTALEMEDKDEVALYGKSTDEIMSFFEKRNSQTFEEWSVSNHGVYMQDFAKNIITNLEKELHSLGVVCTDDTFDKKFEIKNDSIENLMIISHAGTMSVLLSYFLNMPLYAWTWKKFLPRHTGHTRLKSTAISDGHFFRLKEFNNVSFIENPEEQTY